MGAQENAELARRGYEAFSAGDIETLTTLFPENAVWHLAGHGGLAGEKKGRDQIFGYFGDLAGRSGGTFKVTLHDIVAGDTHTVGLHHDHAERDGRVLDHNVVIVIHIEDGQFVEVWEFHEDQEANDAFWS